MNGGGEAVCRAVTILVQHLAVRVPDKADFRREAADAIVTLLSALPDAMLSSCVEWFTRLVSSALTQLGCLSNILSAGWLTVIRPLTECSVWRCWAG